MFTWNPRNKWNVCRPARKSLYKAGKTYSKTGKLYPKSCKCRSGVGKRHRRAWKARLKLLWKCDSNAENIVWNLFPRAGNMSDSRELRSETKGNFDISLGNIKRRQGYVLWSHSAKSREKSSGKTYLNLEKTDWLYGREKSTNRDTCSDCNGSWAERWIKQVI